jgi:hypothetical protein
LVSSHFQEVSRHGVIAAVVVYPCVGSECREEFESGFRTSSHCNGHGMVERHHGVIVDAE